MCDIIGYRRRSAWKWSLISQRHHGIDTGGSKCGQVAGEERAGNQDRNRGAHRNRIVRLDAKQERLQERCGLVGGSESDQELAENG
jgi:hypothetical protein